MNGLGRSAGGFKWLALCVVVVAVTTMCGTPAAETPVVSRLETIPTGAVKAGPETDLYPPMLHDDAWEQPVPLPAPINSAGGEDSPFIMPDGDTLYFFFTPDVSVPAEQQVLDGVTGLWVSHKVDGAWTEPERIILNDDLSLDGCYFVQDDVMWFCSVREGNYREIDFYVAYYREGEWTDWENVGEQLNADYGIGELHISADGNTMYFHAPGGYGGSYLGGLDLWVTEWVDGDWSQPVNLGPLVNSEYDDGWPYLSPDGTELWFLRSHSIYGDPGPALYRSLLQPDGSWGEPVEIVSSFAGEPSLDAAGNLYFVHHYYDAEGTMIEADIYVAYRK